MNTIVSVGWLKQHLNHPDLIVLDASLESTIERKLSNSSLKTIPSSRFFDLKNNFSEADGFPNTVPKEKHFEIECQKLGIHKNSKIVVFDSLGIYSSPRVWWLFNLMGHQDISVLDGGLPEWIHNGFPTETRAFNPYTPGDFKATLQPKYVKNYDDILENLHTNEFLLIDVRSEGRFEGTAREPRKHLKSGHIPNAINIPYNNVLSGGKFKPEEELKTLFSSKYDSKNKLVFSCGSGLTACIVMLANVLVFKTTNAIYDGSWTEWAERQNLKIDVL